MPPSRTFNLKFSTVTPTFLFVVHGLVVALWGAMETRGGSTRRSFLFQKATSSRAILPGSSSCTAWPELGNTNIWNLPCICAIVMSLSSRSVPARIKSLAVRDERNFCVNPVNHSFQYCSEATRSVRQTYSGFCAVDLAEGITSGGKETRADSVFLTVPDLTLHDGQVG